MDAKTKTKLEGMDKEQLIGLLEKVGGTDLEKGLFDIQPESPLGAQPVKTYAEKYLQMLGMPRNLTGFDYIVYSMEILIGDNGLVRRLRLQKELYPKVADHFGTTIGNAERCIRNAISSVTSDPDVENNLSIFGYRSVDKIDTPSKFLYMLAHRIEKDLTD